MRRIAPLLTALLLGLQGCAGQRPVDLADQGSEWGRSPSWTLQARLHSALYRCELLVLNGNNARLAGEQARLPVFRQQLSDCQTTATTVASEATRQLPTGQDRALRNAQKVYMTTWRDYLAGLTIDHPADLQRKQSYLRARSALLETATQEQRHHP
ncbi:hypothetical protein [Pseudomonas oryzihabitans]|uniref:hypothetical protein n=1 Tax=Pseudomonas oryzihabitans TaxID=47885 RepID=UPI00111FB4DD|nr:hypothetical protein [Pseudomonas psychrotolerans]QDD91527.1 hypothetical protein CCZ28_21960 [Pseudomonas psychrotolerans]